MTHFSSFGVVLPKEPLKRQTSQQTFVDADLPELHKAAAYGDLQTVTDLIKEDRSLLKQPSAEGLTPLAQAVQCQQLESVKLLIKLGADINAQDNVGRTCLSVAAYQGWHDGVVCLLHNGAKQDISDKSGRYPLHAATYHSDTNTLSLLLQNLTSKEVNQPDHELMTAVHWAAFHDRPDHLMQLVQKGGDILAKDVDGKLPLHWAAQNGSFQCAHRLTSLIDGLATVNAIDNSHKSPAHYAAASGSANILTILSHCDKIKLEIEDPDERTPLHWAAAMGHPKAVETLLKLGVNPFPTDMDGCTPLDYAIQGENDACVKVMESVLGLKSSKLSRSRQSCFSQSRQQTEPGGKPQMMGTEIKYRYRKGSSPLPLPAATMQGPAVPDINVLPPTTTLTAATEHTAPTTVVDMPEADAGTELPRMYSASTDTDVNEFSTPYHVGATTQRAPIPESGKALVSLINSSFLAGAQGPILNHDTPYGVVRQGETSADKDSRWGHKTSGSILPSSASRHGEVQELKVMTSTNTPDLNRVSVQSFRSIPPISDRSEAPPEHMSRLAGHGSKKSSAAGSALHRPEIKLPPLRHQQSLIGNNKPILPVSGVENTNKPHAQQSPPHDFMTENVAETRILTRMWKKTARDVIHQSHRMGIPPLPPTKDVVKATNTNASSNHTNNTNNTILSSRSSKDGTVAMLIKHSRIPSTKMIPSRNAPISSKKTRDKSHRANFRNSNNNDMAMTPYAADDLTQGQYLDDEGCSKPLTPTPLMSIQISKRGKHKTSEHQQQHHQEHVGKSRSKAKEAGGSKNKKNLQRLSNRYSNIVGQENKQGNGNANNMMEEKIMDMPSLYKGDKRKDGRRAKQDRKLAIAHQMAYS